MDFVEIVSVKVADTPGVRGTLVKLKDSWGPDGEMDALNSTVPEKPLTPARVTMVAPEEPAGILRLAGLAEIAKPTRERNIVARTCTEPLVPVTVTV